MVYHESTDYKHKLLCGICALIILRLHEMTCIIHIFDDASIIHMIIASDTLALLKSGQDESRLMIVLANFILTVNPENHSVCQVTAEFIKQLENPPDLKLVYALLLDCGETDKHVPYMEETEHNMTSKVYNALVCTQKPQSFVDTDIRSRKTVT
jgi:hypothetical protein